VTGGAATYEMLTRPPVVGTGNARLMHYVKAQRPRA